MTVTVTWKPSEMIFIVYVRANSKHSSWELIFKCLYCPADGRQIHIIALSLMMRQIIALFLPTGSKMYSIALSLKMGDKCTLLPYLDWWDIVLLPYILMGAVYTFIALSLLMGVDYSIKSYTQNCVHTGKKQLHVSIFVVSRSRLASRVNSHYVVCRLTALDIVRHNPSRNKTRSIAREPIVN